MAGNLSGNLKGMALFIKSFHFNHAGRDIIEATSLNSGLTEGIGIPTRLKHYLYLLVIQHIICSTSKNEEKLEKRDFFALSLGFCGDRRGPVTMSYHMTKNAMRFYQESLNDNGDT